MNTMELRHKLLQHINTADERLLRIVNAVFESYRESGVQEEEEEIVAYTVSGEPLTKEQYLRDLQEAEAEIERGEYITHEDLKKEVSTWGK